MRNSILKQATVILLTSVSLPALAQDQSDALRAAYEQYAAARIAMSQTEAGSAEAAVQTDAAINAQSGLAALCADLGSPDLAACFDQFLPPEIRVPNDAAPIAPVAAPAPVEPAPAPAVEPAPVEVPVEVPVEKPMEQPVEQPVEQPAETPKEVPAPDKAPEIQPAPAAEPAPQPAEKPVVQPEPATKAEPAAQPDPNAQPTEDMAGENVKPEEIAPLLDSAKEEPVAEAPADKSGKRPLKVAPVAEEPAAPAPTSDAEAQSKVAPQTIQAVEAEQGQPVADQQASRMLRATNAPEAAKPVQQEQGGLRIVFQFGNQLIVENPDSTRLTGRTSERTIEELRRDRTRETIIRDDGTRIVTIYNRNGDILQRSKFTPDGREIVLVYVSEDRENDLLEWRDPGQDLPPLRLSIPARDYVLDSEYANEREVIRFLDQPPVESVRRLYSIDEVKRSARVRDSVRRLEIGGLTFDSARATISPDQVSALTSTAKAMLDLLDDNPAETFLIEGHTDAVGSEISNLELSDRRAETVAIVLSDVFGIPPENLTTQGYGERYLKVRTQNDERLNRRVTIRRITPLISPIARR